METELGFRRTSRPSLTRIIKLEVLVNRLSQLRRSLDGQDGVDLVYQMPRRRSKRGGSLHPENNHQGTLRHSQSFPQQLYTEGEEHQSNEIANIKRAYLQRKRALGKKFRFAVRLCVLCKRLSKAHSLRSKAYDELTPFISGLHFHDFDYAEDALLFDPSQFKANRQLRISEEAKRVLAMPSDGRMERDLHYTQVALRNNAAFSQYPVRMQRKIVEVGGYEKFEAKRVVVRQGHPARAFYFILSGSVVVLITDPETKITKPVAYMYKGMTFGELAIINRTIRQASIVAKETIELMSIDIEDFHNIFMAGGVKNINDPDHNQFVKGLVFLKDWPIELMTDNPKTCIFHYFKSGETMVKDSHYSDWIYIVKSGSIKVMKKLKRVEAIISQNKRRQAEEEKRVCSENMIRDRINMRDKQRRFILPDLQIPLTAPDDSVDPRFTLKHSLPPIIRIDSVDYAKPSTSTMSLRLPEVDVTLDTGSDERTKIRSQSQQDSSSSSLGSRLLITKGEGRLGNYRRRRKGVVSIERNVMAKEELEEMAGRKQHIRTIAEDFDAKFREKNPRDLTEADLDPQFVHIQTLTKGQGFGISEAVLGKQPSFCVISNGAECIMIDKAFYLQHAPESLIRTLRQTCCPYPSDEAMQDGLQTSVDWEAYKSLTFAETMKQIQQKKSESRHKIW